MSQRSQFKFEAGQANPVGVVLFVPGRSPLRGEPLTIHHDGVRGRFPAQQELGLALGKKAALRFTSKEWKSPIETVCVLHFRHDDDSLRELGFSFVQRREVDEELFPLLRALFNRRSATRAAPDSKEPIVVSLEETRTGRCLHGPLLDISGTGMLLRVSVDEEAMLADARDCRVAFLLPGPMPARLALTVRIRERRLYPDHVQLGLEFDAARSTSFASQRDAVLAYVLSRQPRSTHRLKAG